MYLVLYVSRYNDNINNNHSIRLARRSTPHLVPQMRAMGDTRRKRATARQGGQVVRAQLPVPSPLRGRVLRGRRDEERAGTGRLPHPIHVQRLRLQRRRRRRLEVSG